MSGVPSLQRPEQHWRTREAGRRRSPAGGDHSIDDIAVRFAGYKITRVHLEPEGRDLPMHRTKTGVEVVVPALNIHSMVVAELAP